MNCPKRGVRYRDGHGARCRGVRVPELTGSTPAAQGAKPGVIKSFGGGIDTDVSRSTLLL